MSITTDRGLMIDLVDHAPDQPSDAAGVFLGKIFAAAQPGAVFGAPIVSGALTVITASEVAAGGGFGSGRATIPKPAVAAHGAGVPAAESGGSGGGGGASGRPIAAIIIGPDGVTIKPVFDVTKIALASITALGAMLGMFLKLRARAR
jgi:uncharacterized spore protein YtfJ